MSASPQSLNECWLSCWGCMAGVAAALESPSLHPICALKGGALRRRSLLKCWIDSLILKSPCIPGPIRREMDIRCPAESSRSVASFSCDAPVQGRHSTLPISTLSRPTVRPSRWRWRWTRELATAGRRWPPSSVMGRSHLIRAEERVDGENGLGRGGTGRRDRALVMSTGPASLTPNHRGMAARVRSGGRHEH